MLFQTEQRVYTSPEILVIGGLMIMKMREWVDDGPYQSAGISEDNAEDVNDILSRKYESHIKQVISAINDQGYEATAGLWVNNRKFAPTHVKSIEFYSKQFPARIYIFAKTGYGSAVQVWDIIDAGTSTVGFNNIIYDKDVPSNLYVGVMNAGLAYDNAGLKDINGNYTLPKLSSTSNGRAVNYVLVYDYKDNKAKALMGNDSIDFNQDFARNLMICGFTIWGLNPERRYSATIWSPNRDYLTLIM